MRLKNKKKLKYLRSHWGKQLDKFRYFDLISIYHDSIYNKDSINYVDEKTWSDLDFNSIFSKMDRNVSCLGQQFLYHLVHKYENDETVLKERYSLIQYLRKNSSVRESIQLLLSNLSNQKAYFIPSLIMSNIPPRSKYFYLLVLLSLLTLISSSLIYFQPQFLFVTIALLTTNIILNHVIGSKIYDSFAGFSSLYTLLIASSQISKIKSEYSIGEFEFLRKQKGLIKKLKKKLGKFVIDKDGLNDVARVIIEYLNMFFLYDLIAYYKSVNILNKYQLEVRKIYESVASLDACISVASYL
ncbi:MAG: hypothetical protein KAI45_04350, partial [Melioribacteraceae bacterium]|nr:hypothetical protein [Melioribacteraceae bacterium]